MNHTRFVYSTLICIDRFTGKTLLLLALSNLYKKTRHLIGHSGFKTAGLYTFSNFFAKGLSFLFIPVFTNPRYLSPADNGILNMYSQAVLFVLPFISLGLIQTASVDYFTKNKKNFQDFCFTAFTMSLMTAVAAFFIFVFARDFLVDIFHFPPEFVWSIPLLAFLLFIFEFVLTIVRNREDAGKFVKMNMAKISIELGLAVLLIVPFSWTWGGRIAGMIVSTCLVAAYGIAFLYRTGYLKGKLRLNIFRNEIRFSMPVILMQVSMFFLTYAGTFILAWLTGDKALIGVFGLAMVFGSVVITFSQALIQYYIPKINRELSKPQSDYRILYVYLKQYGLAVTAWFILLLAIIPFIYLRFINPLYHDGIPYYFSISPGLLMWSFAAFLYRFPLFFKEKTILIVLGIGSIVISLGFNYFFILRWRAMGASLALLFSYLIVFLFVAFFTRGHIKKMWRVAKL